jgi:hypothetical protein
MKDVRDKIVDKVEKAHDALDEALHRSAADAEHAHREHAGDTMTPGEKFVSGVNELKHRTEAELIAAKNK